MVIFIRETGTLTRPDPGARVLAAEDHTAVLDAEAVLAAAREEAAQIGRTAQAAYESEVERGYREGLERAHNEAAERMVENVARTVEYFGAVEGRMTDLLIQAMRRLIANYNHRERARIVIKNALTAVRTQKHITLRVAADQVDAVREMINEVLVDFPAISYLDVQADSRLSDEACVVETEIGVVEASLQGQIEAMRLAFAKVLGKQK